MTSSHALSSIKLESWKNIPLCIVNAIKLIVDNNESIESKLRLINSKYEVLK